MSAHPKRRPSLRQPPEPVSRSVGSKGRGSIGVELNKLEGVGGSCRAYFVFANGTDRADEALKLDLVIFDRDGVIAKLPPFPEGMQVAQSAFTIPVQFFLR